MPLRYRPATMTMTLIIKGNFNGQGDEVMGWFDPADGKWTETDPAAQAANKAEENE